MPVTPNDVRAYLPVQAVTALPDPLIEGWIASWRERANLVTGGVSEDENRAIFEAICLGAASRGYSVLFRGQSTDEPGQAEAYRKEAKDLLQTVDALTSGANELDILSANLVSNTIEKPLWE